MHTKALIPLVLATAATAQSYGAGFSAHEARDVDHLYARDAEPDFDFDFEHHEAELHVRKAEAEAEADLDDPYDELFAREAEPEAEFEDDDLFRRNRLDEDELYRRYAQLDDDELDLFARAAAAEAEAEPVVITPEEMKKAEQVEKAASKSIGHSSWFQQLKAMAKKLHKTKKTGKQPNGEGGAAGGGAEQNEAKKELKKTAKTDDPNNPKSSRGQNLANYGSMGTMAPGFFGGGGGGGGKEKQPGGGAGAKPGSPPGGGAGESKEKRSLYADEDAPAHDFFARDARAAPDPEAYADPEAWADAWAAANPDALFQDDALDHAADLYARNAAPEPEPEPMLGMHIHPVPNSLLKDLNHKIRELHKLMDEGKTMTKHQQMEFPFVAKLQGMGPQALSKLSRHSIRKGEGMPGAGVESSEGGSEGSMAGGSGLTRHESKKMAKLSGSGGGEADETGGGGASSEIGKRAEMLYRRDADISGYYSDAQLFARQEESGSSDGGSESQGSQGQGQGQAQSQLTHEDLQQANEAAKVFMAIEAKGPAPNPATLDRYPYLKKLALEVMETTPEEGGKSGKGGLEKELGEAEESTAAADGGEQAGGEGGASGSAGGETAESSDGSSQKVARDLYARHAEAAARARFWTRMLDEALAVRSPAPAPAAQPAAHPGPEAEPEPEAFAAPWAEADAKADEAFAAQYY